MSLRGTVARDILGSDCINAEKAELEGQWSEEALILGFVSEYDVLRLTNRFTYKRCISF